MAPTIMRLVYLECGSSVPLRHGVPVYGFIDYGRDNLLQGGPVVGSIEGDRRVYASENLVNEKLTFCTYFPIPTADPDSCRCPAGMAHSMPGLQLPWQMLSPEDWTDALSFARNHGIVLRACHMKEPVPGFTSLEILLSQ